MSKEKKAYSYIRMSTVNQLKGDSLRRQTAAAKEYAEQNNLTLDEDLNFLDLGVSAYKGENARTGGLSHFLEAAKKGDIKKGSTLIVESLDRISRAEVRLAAEIFLSILNSGITIVTLMDGMTYHPDSTDSMPLIQSLMIMARANEESEIKSKRLISKWENKREQIKHKKLTSMCPKWLILSKDKKEFYSIQDRVKIINKIFDLSIMGQGDHSIVKTLNKEKIAPFGNGIFWQKSSVTKLLQNRALIGEFQPYRMVGKKREKVGDIIHNYFPTVIEPSKFQKAQIARQSRKVCGAGNKSTYSNNLFAGLLYCAECNGKMHYVNKGTGPKGGQYLICDNKRRGVIECDSTTWKYQEFETSFLSIVSELDLPKILVNKTSNIELEDLENKINHLICKIDTAKHARERVFDLLTATPKSENYLIEKIEKLSKEITSNEAFLVKTEKDLESIHQSKDHIVKNSAEVKLLISQLATNSFDNISDLRKKLAQQIKNIVSAIRVASRGASNLQSELYMIPSQTVGEEKEVELFNQNRFFDVWYREFGYRRIFPKHNKPEEFIEQIQHIKNHDNTTSLQRIMVDGTVTSKLLARHFISTNKKSDFK
jgi:DNA invertase Pin-like site-specific DNA recombinase